MIEEGLNMKKRIEPTSINSEIEEIKRWFNTEYVYRINTANRYKYLGLPMTETRYAVELEAYEKENRLRELMGEELLPDPKFTNII